MPALDISDYRSQVYDSETGLVVATANDHMAATVKAESLHTRGNRSGYALTRDEQTTIISWPRKNSGLDDYAYDKIAEGDIANIGVHPSPDPIMSSLIESLTNEASIAEITLMAGESRRQEVRMALGRANDSTMGVSGFLNEFTWGHYVYNRGNCVDICGATHLAFDRWESEGLVAVPLLKEHQTEKDADTFYLESYPVDYSRPLRTIKPWNYAPTSNPEWPVMIRKNSAELGRSVWVYLHHTQVIRVQTNRSSSVHRYMGLYASELLFELEGSIEKMLNEPEDGIIFLTGISDKNGKQIEDRIFEQHEEKDEDGRKLQQGYHFITTSENRAKAVMLSWRKFDKADFRERVIKMASTFDVNAMDYFPIEGIGYTGQASTQSFKSGTKGVMIPLGIFGRMLMAIFPNMYAGVTLPNSRADEMRLDNLVKLKDAVGELPYSDDDKLWLAENLASVSVPSQESNDIGVSNVDDNLDDVEEDGGGEDSGG